MDIYMQKINDNTAVATLHDFIFAKVVHNIAFKSHSPTCYVSNQHVMYLNHILDRF